MKAYSVDLREKVLRAVDQGYPRAEIIMLLGVSRATIKRYLKQRRETGSVAPKAIPGRTPKKLGLLQAELVMQLQAHVDLRLEDQCRLWEQTHGVQVSTTTMSQAMSLSGIGACMIIEGSVNALAFLRLCGTPSGSQSDGGTDRGAGQFERPQRSESAPAHRGTGV
jgi:transposase